MILKNGCLFSNIVRAQQLILLMSCYCVKITIKTCPWPFAGVHFTVNFTNPASQLSVANGEPKRWLSINRESFIFSGQ